MGAENTFPQPDRDGRTAGETHGPRSQVQELVAPFVEALRRHVHEKTLVLLVYQSRSTAVRLRRVGFASFHAVFSPAESFSPTQVDVLLFALLEQTFTIVGERREDAQQVRHEQSTRCGRVARR